MAVVSAVAFVATLWQTWVPMLPMPGIETFGEMLAALDGRAIPEEVDVVFSADDLGVSRHHNRGIRAAVECGPVREAGLCATGVAFDDGVRTARALGPELGVGLHLSLTLGEALTGPIPGITRADGSFLTARELLVNCLRQIPDARLVRAEIRAQLDRLLQLDIEPTHLSGHESVHVLPVVRDAVLRVVRDHSIRYVRVPWESGFVGRWSSSRRLLLSRLSAAFVQRARQTGSGFRSLPFVGVAPAPARDPRAGFLKTATRLAAPAQEWRVRTQHAAEVAVLTCPDVARRLLELRIHPRRFADVLE
jgi:predicted glycoside hydrolase/deacetylase ChbG (UPF0249 family)